MKLTRADKAAIQNGDSNYLLNKGIHYFYDQDYEVAVEYYHLAASMGNGKAAGQLGYCYLYGKGVPAEVDLGLSYFRVGMDQRDVDSYYKMGKIYCVGDVLEEDHELGVYYYESALAELLENYSYSEHVLYPELFHALALESLPGGGMREDVSLSYKYLLIAEAGYSIMVKEGAYYLEDALKEVQEKKALDYYQNVSQDVQKEFDLEYLSR